MDDILLGAEAEILERVDEYTLYCHYLGFSPDLHMKYTSPIPADKRGGSVDKSPSFGIFRATKIANREFAWKDMAAGLSGDIFNLVKILFGYQRKEQAVRKIASDFGFGPKVEDSPRVCTPVPVEREPTNITVQHRPFKQYDFDWWRKFNISRGILEHYKVRPITCYWTHDAQKTPKFPSNGFGFVYKIGIRHQLYFPLAQPGFKFRNDLTKKELMGFDQLHYKTNTVIITKSYKDIMCLRSFQYDAVAPQGESVLIPDEYLRYLEQKYSRILVLFDNDGKHKAESYPYPKIWVPQGQKDISDYCKANGPKAAEELLTHLIP